MGQFASALPKSHHVPLKLAFVKGKETLFLLAPLSSLRLSLSLPLSRSISSPSPKSNYNPSSFQFPNP